MDLLGGSCQHEVSHSAWWLQLTLLGASSAGVSPHRGWSSRLCGQAGAELWLMWRKVPPRKFRQELVAPNQAEMGPWADGQGHGEATVWLGRDSDVCHVQSVYRHDALNSAVPCGRTQANYVKPLSVFMWLLLTMVFFSFTAPHLRSAVLKGLVIVFGTLSISLAIALIWKMSKCTKGCRA